MSFKKILISNTYYFSSNLLGIILGAVRGGLIAHFLGPALYGMWSILGVANQYANLSHLGFLPGFDREYPYYQGKGDNRYAEDLKNSAFSVTMLLSIVCAVVLLSISFITPYISNSKELVFGLRFLSIILILSQAWEFFIIYLRNNQNFKLLSICRGMYAVIFTLFAIPMTYYFAFKGLVVALLLSFIPGILFFCLDFLKSIAINFDKKIIAALFLTGWPFFGMQVLGLVSASLDKLLVFKYLSSEMLGYYSFALLIIGLSKTISESTVYVLRPLILHKAGLHSNDNMFLKKDFILISSLAAYFYPIIIVTIFILIGPAISMIMPRYGLSIEITRILCWGLLPSCVAIFSAPFIVASNKQKYLFYIGMINVMVMLSFIYLLAYPKMEINNIAVAIAASQYINALLLLNTVFRIYHLGIKNIILTVGKLFLPFLTVMMVITLISKRMDGLDIISQFSYIGAQFVVAIIVFVPLSITVFKRLMLRKNG